jgi:polyvinyl alcohol dehydrogenase (cytochrome)
MAAWLTVAGGVAAAPPAEWPFVNGDLGNMRAAAVPAIMAKDASRIGLLWSAPLKGAVRLATPVSDAETLFLPTAAGYLARIDKKSGRVMWQVDLAAVTGVAGASSRGSVAVSGDRVIVAIKNKPVIAALNKADGGLVWKTKIDPHPLAQISQSPIVAGGRVFIGVSSTEEAMPALRPGYACCDFRGSLVALDAASGDIEWKTYVLPQGYAGAPIWSSAAAYDARRRVVYATTGNAYQAPETVLSCVAATRGTSKPASACWPDGVWFDSVVAFDAATGAIKWGFRGDDDDVFTAGCVGLNGAPITECGNGPDFDFGGAPMLWTREGRDYLGAGQKSGVFWTLNPDTGQVIWRQTVGPGGPLGGIEFGTATDGARIYVANSNAKFLGRGEATDVLPNGETTTAGSIGALDTLTGKPLWRVADPAGKNFPGNNKPCGDPSTKDQNCVGAFLKGPVTVDGGLAFVCSTEPEGHMYGFDTASGALRWSFASGAGCESGAAVLDGVIYWAANQTLLAFSTDGRAAAPERPAAPATVGAALTIADGVFAQAQVERGRVAYQRSCAAGCHLESLMGRGPAVALVGADFLSRWKGLSVADLMNKVRETMPADKPNSLANDDYLAVVAYLLSANGFSPGGRPMTDAPMLREIKIVGRE